MGGGADGEGASGGGVPAEEEGSDGGGSSGGGGKEGADDTGDEGGGSDGDVATAGGGDAGGDSGGVLDATPVKRSGLTTLPTLPFVVKGSVSARLVVTLPTMNWKVIVSPLASA